MNYHDLPIEIVYFRTIFYVEQDEKPHQNSSQQKHE